MHAHKVGGEEEMCGNDPRFIIHPPPPPASDNDKAENRSESPRSALKLMRAAGGEEGQRGQGTAHRWKSFVACPFVGKCGAQFTTGYEPMNL